MTLAELAQLALDRGETVGRYHHRAVLNAVAAAVDAYLASPEAVEQWARAMRYHPDLRGKEGEYVEGWDAATRVALTVLRKVRADD